MTQITSLSADSPKLKVRFLKHEYGDINDFHLTAAVLDIYNKFRFVLPNPDGRALALIDADPHRWEPIKIWHSDPLVNVGAQRELLTGVITKAVLNVSPGAPSTLSIEGYDCGKLLDSSGPAWKRIRSTWEDQFKAVVDPSWLAANRSDDWGIKGVVGYDRNRLVKGRFAATQASFTAKKRDGYMPPLQIQVGESVYSTLSKFARLSGYQLDEPGGAIVNVSADGFIQLFNPDDSANDAAAYSIDLFDNQRFKGAELILNGEPLYSSYTCFGSNIIPPKEHADTRNPNLGIYRATARGDGLARKTLARPLTFGDEEAYTPEMRQARAEWRRRRAEYDAETIQITLQGHSIPAAGRGAYGPGGAWLPIVEGFIVDLNAPQLRRRGRFYLEAVDLHQVPAPQGTYAVLRLKKLGLLSS